MTLNADTRGRRRPIWQVMALLSLPLLLTGCTGTVVESYPVDAQGDIQQTIYEVGGCGGLGQEREECYDGLGLDEDCDLKIDEDLDLDADEFFTHPCQNSDRPSDCDDDNPDVNPDATEVCDPGPPVDNDCDGLLDDADPSLFCDPRVDTLYYRDDDGDGYLNSDEPQCFCAHPGAGWFSEEECPLEGGTCQYHHDCDDTDPDINPGEAERCVVIGEEGYNVDENCNDDRDEGYIKETCDPDADGDLHPGGDGGTDCSDTDASIHPGAPEVCDGVDQDCDERFDEGVVTTWYLDSDHDGWGNGESFHISCDPPGESWVDVALDCDDSAANIYPGATEVPQAALGEITHPSQCNGIDEDCDGLKDEDAADCQDSDGDGARPLDGDCDDARSDVSPNAEEHCYTTPEADEDCDGDTDEHGAVDARTWYVDLDGDGFGDDLGTTQACLQPEGYVAVGGDCDDGHNTAWPGATEVCDAMDNDCDGDVDESGAQDARPWYLDADDDGYGADGTPIYACGSSPPLEHVDNAEDCHDGDPVIFPGATERCDAPWLGVDVDCDGAADEGTVCFDDDQDGFSEQAGDCDDTDANAFPGGNEQEDGRDGDCDGLVDGILVGCPEGAETDIQAAIDRADNGAAIQVCDGVYPGGIRNDYRDFSLWSRNTHGAVIDCAGEGVGISITSHNGPVTIGGFLLRGCDTAVFLRDDFLAGQTVTSCKFADNLERAISVYDGSPEIRNCIFEGNTGFYGSAIEARRAGLVAVEGCTFEDNVATEDELGAAVHLDGSGVSMQGNTFLDNTPRHLTLREGGAGRSYHSSSDTFRGASVEAIKLSNMEGDPVWLESPRIEDNGKRGITTRGGSPLHIEQGLISGHSENALYLADMGDTLIEDVTFRDNPGGIIYANGTGRFSLIESRLKEGLTVEPPSGNSGAVSVIGREGAVTIHGNTFHNNGAPEIANIGALDVYSAGPLAVTSNFFMDNTGMLVGALMVKGEEDALVANNLFWTDVAQVATAIYATGPALKIVNNLIMGGTSNTETDPANGAVRWYSAGAEGVFQNNLILYNEGCAIYISADAPPTQGFNLFYDNTRTYCGDAEPSESDLYTSPELDVVWGATLLDTQFNLTAESPAVDSGADLSALGFDVDAYGTSRPQGGGWDRGHQEYVP